MQWRIKSIACLLVASSILFGLVQGFEIPTSLSGVMPDHRGTGLLLSKVEHREKQLEALASERKKLEERLAVAKSEIGKTLGNIQQQLKETETLLQSASGSSEELLKNKQEVLNERKRNLTNLRELWVESDSKLVRHIKLVEEIRDELRSGMPEGVKRAIYSWRDFEKTKGEIDALAGRIKEEEAKRTRLNELKAVEEKDVQSLKKEIDIKIAERDKVSKEIEGLSEKEEGAAFISELRAKSDVIEQEIVLLREKIRVAELKQENLGRDERHKDDEVFLLKHRLKNLSDTFAHVQQKLVVDLSDVELAKGEFDQAKRGASKEITHISREMSLRKARREGFAEKIDPLEQELESVTKKGEAFTSRDYLLESRLILLKNEKKLADRELEFLGTRKEKEEVSVDYQQLRVQIIELLHSLGLRREVEEDRLVELRSKMSSAKNARNSVSGRQTEIISLVSTINKEIEDLQARQKEVLALRNKTFRESPVEYREVLANFKRSALSLSNQKSMVERHFSQITELLNRQNDIINQYSFVVKYLEVQKTVSIWRRSSRAISAEQLWRAAEEAESLGSGLFWDTPVHLGPFSILESLKRFSLVDYLGFLLFFLFLALFVFSCKLLLLFVRRVFSLVLLRTGEHFSSAFITGLDYFVEFLQQNAGLLFSWVFVMLHFALPLSYFKPLMNAYAHTNFWLLSIFVAIALSRRFVSWIKKLNQNLQFLFISEPLQWKFLFLIESFLYATSILLPLRAAFLVYFNRDVDFAEVSLAAYTLILVVIILFFFNKDDLLRILSGKNRLVVWLRDKVDQYYYPVFIFFMFLLMLSNPYIGYSSLAWYLAFAVPASILLIYGLFLLHFFVRKFSLFFFIKEEDDVVTNKFEHAKAYYGLFVVMSFIIFALGTLIILARLWGLEGYSITDLWKALSEDWVISTGTGPHDRLGFIELGKLGLFITGGLVISSFIKKFILGKLFDIFRTEPGVQNTFSKISHYAIIIIAVILGFTAINLSQYALTVGGLLFIGVGFGLKDQITDYFAGILVLLERPIEIGHYVESGEHAGKVHRISARSTTIKTASNRFITIPNRDLISKPIVNWGQGRYAVGCELKVMVSFDSDPEQVKKVLLDIIKQHALVLRVPTPIVRFEGFESSALYFYCRCYVSARKLLDMWDLQSDLRFAIVKGFKEAGIVIPYSHMVVHVAKKNATPEQVSPPNPIEIKIDGDKE